MPIRYLNMGLDHGVGHPNSLRMRYKHLRTSAQAVLTVSDVMLRVETTFRAVYNTTHAAPPGGDQDAQLTGYAKMPSVGKSPFRTVSVCAKPIHSLIIVA